MKFKFKFFLIAALFAGHLPVTALEFEECEARLSSFKKPQRFLEIVKALGLSTKATWDEIEPLMIRVSSDLGVRSISIKPKSRTIETIVLIGKDPPSDDPNITINAVTIRSKNVLTTYTFQNGKGYVTPPRP
jgi:hypothetical protein